MLGQLTADQAVDLHNELSQGGTNLVIWTVTKNPSDFPEPCFVARPHAICTPRVTIASEFFLIADTLNELRNSLPYGLTNMVRQTGDDPVIVEVWL